MGIKDDILTAGSMLLREKGVTALTQPQVARAANIKQGHLTYYFSSRASFLLAIAEFTFSAMQMTFFFFLPSILLSGFMFPFRGMPQWAQVFGNALPLTHFLQRVRGIRLKGNGLELLLPHIWPLLLFIAVVPGGGLKAFRPTLD
ncbi:MAG: TetR family transcriptional regulator [Gallionellaceae bacterium]|nr:MAG: TetR family transcriptional regulator [Gallionellaceae bacterium]